ncbi:MAG: PIG-L family deacetylase [Proteobacteria bacterium]|nr:PIG-L family deacetylase [Pseudomonadota bacterium]MBU2235319.1 PIG-L family deacetylase [Pseudomonadota bacterium]
MKILAIGAHPDDIEAGCSGTLAKYAQNGHDIYLLIMTEGHMGGEGAIRKKEQTKSAKILKPRELIWGAYKDTLLLPHMNQMVHDIEAVLKKTAPDFIFVHYEDDTHQDHQALAKATISATRYVRNVLFYEGPTTQNFSPTVFVDIKETLDKKFAMLLAHHSQVQKTNIEGLSITDIVRSTAIFRGIQGRVQFAEAFLPLRIFINVSQHM